jgi:hypothetical protein
MPSSKERKLKERAIKLSKKPLVGLKSSLKVRCDHRYPLAVIFTELGCHARCPNCGAVGPGRPSSEAARQTLVPQYDGYVRYYR